MPRWLFFTLFLSVVLVIVGGLHLFVYRRVRDVFAPPRWATALLAAVLISGPACLLAGRLLARGGEAPASAIIGTTIYGAIETLGVVLAAALLVPVAFTEGLVRHVRRRRRRVPSVASEAMHPVDASDENPEFDTALAREPAAACGPAPAREGAAAPVLAPLPRRAFLGQVTTGAALAVAGGTSLHGGLFGRHDYRIEEVPIVLRGLPRTLDGYTLVQLSDIHVGAFVQEPELRAAEALVRRARADLVVLTGDLVDHDPAYAPKLGELARRLGALARRRRRRDPGQP